MADQLKAGDGKAVSGRLPTQKELTRFLADTERYGKEAAEHSGFIGSATRLLADQYSLNRKSLSFVRTLAKMDRAKGASFWAEVQALVDIAGLADTATLLDTLEGGSEDGEEPSHYTDEETPPEPIDEDAEAAERNAKAIKKGIDPTEAVEDGKKRGRQSPRLVHAN
jgi:hypothetical protein